MEAPQDVTGKHSRSTLILVFLTGGFLPACGIGGFHLLSGRIVVISANSAALTERKISDKQQQLKKQDDYILSQNATLKIQQGRIKDRDDRLIEKTRLIETQMQQIAKQNDYIIHLSNVKNNSDDDINLYAIAGRKLLKELIAKDFPQMNNPDLDDWTKVNLLREWAFQNSDWGTGETLIVPDSKFNLHGLPPQAIFANFLDDKKGTFCGGVSVSLMKLYRMFGFPAYAYGMGDLEGFTHTVTLVSIEHRGKNIFAIEDAALNLTYANSQSEPLDFFAMLKLLKKQQHEQIELLEGKAKSRDLIVADRKLMETFRDLIVPATSQGQRLPDGRIKCQILVNLDVVKEKFGEKIDSFLRKNKQPTDPIYLFMHPILFDGIGNTDALAERTREIVQPKTVATKLKLPTKRD